MKTHILVLAALLSGAGGLHAQAPAADTLPACADGGISRLAVTVPPGQTREEVVQALNSSGALPAGTQVRILESHDRPSLVNRERFNELVRMHIHRFLRAGLQVDGEATTLVRVDANGRVVEVDAASGNREVDGELRRLWRQARFEPVLVGSCRAPAYLHLNLRFASDFDEDWRQTTIGEAP
jgi:hypothetical protein